jgi:hypothetical protein
MLVSRGMPRSRRSAATAASIAALTAAAVAGCASTQTVRITCVPQRVSVYVDGRLIEGSEADLQTDRPHKIFVKGPGFEPRLVVLEPELGEDGRAAFRDDEVCVEVVPVGMKRELEVEVEPGAVPEAR